MSIKKQLPTKLVPSPRPTAADVPAVADLSGYLRSELLFELAQPRWYLE